MHVHRLCLRVSAAQPMRKQACAVLVGMTNSGPVCAGDVSKDGAAAIHGQPAEPAAPMHAHRDGLHVCAVSDSTFDFIEQLSVYKGARRSFCIMLLMLPEASGQLELGHWVGWDGFRA